MPGNRQFTLAGFKVDRKLLVGFADSFERLNASILTVHLRSGQSDDHREINGCVLPLGETAVAWAEEITLVFAAPNSSLWNRGRKRSHAVRQNWVSTPYWKPAVMRVFERPSRQLSRCFPVAWERVDAYRSQLS